MNRIIAAIIAAAIAFGISRAHAATALERAQQSAAIAACKVEWIKAGNKVGDMRTAQGFHFVAACLDKRSGQ